MKIHLLNSYLTCVCVYEKIRKYLKIFNIIHNVLNKPDVVLVKKIIKNALLPTYE